MKKILILFCAIMLAGCASTPTRATTTYYRDAPSNNTQYVPVQQTRPVYVQQPATQNTQDEYNKKIIKQGLLGAATGAIAAEASGGKAGKGALIGAGTNVIGGALFDMLTTPQAQQQPQYTTYSPYATQWAQENQNKQKIIRKYDSNGNVVSEETVWQ